MRDLHEAVTAVQDLGIRLTLVGIEPMPGQFNQSKELVLDADEVVVLTRSEIGHMFTSLANGPSAQTLPLPLTTVTSDQVKQAAEAFAEGWASNAAPNDLAELIANKPRVPQPLDRELLTEVERLTNSSLRGNDAAHRNARQAFWKTILSKRAQVISEA